MIQRAAVHAGAMREWVDADLGSKLTMKYPSCYLVGERARGEILWMAFAGPGQHQDTGGKVIHSAPHTLSEITSQSISRSNGRTSYRGLVKIYKGAHQARPSRNEPPGATPGGRQHRLGVVSAVSGKQAPNEKR